MRSTFMWCRFVFAVQDGSNVCVCVDDVLNCGYLNEGYSAVLSYGIQLFVMLYKMVLMFQVRG